MRKLLLFAAFAAAAVTFAALVNVVLPASAEAFPKQLVKLVSSDAGATQTYHLLTTEADLCMQCPTQLTCFKTAVWDAGSLVPDCTKDYNVAQTNAAGLFEWCGDQAFDTAIAAMQTDGGAVNCWLYSNFKNRPRSPAR